MIYDGTKLIRVDVLKFVLPFSVGETRRVRQSDLVPTIVSFPDTSPTRCGDLTMILIDDQRDLLPTVL